MTPLVCLISPAPLWVNPRLRKEADALLAAGYDVVVGYRADGDLSRDDAILASKPWRWQRIDLARDRHAGRWLAAAVRQRSAEWIVRTGVRAARVDGAAYCRGDRALLAWAAAQDADLYIGHTQPVLRVAAAAAGRRGVPFALDCEDLLAEEAADGGRGRWRRDLIVRLERQYLRQAAYVSATSTPMAAYLAEQYALSDVPVWHNCFPASESAHLAPPAQRVAPHGPVGLTWISATIGPGRGLEDAFAALTRLGPRVELHLYGAVPPQYSVWLERLMAPLRGVTTVELHPVPAPEGVLETLARHRIGLTLDSNETVNRSLTICNKVFLYLQAGLACVATDTPGQRSVLPPGSAHGALYPPGDIDALVAVLMRLTDRGALAAAQDAAWDIARQRYAWDVEKARFLHAVSRALAGGSGEGRGRGDGGG